jgi:hypothetical protein
LDADFAQAVKAAGIDYIRHDFQGRHAIGLDKNRYVVRHVGDFRQHSLRLLERDWLVLQVDLTFFIDSDQDQDPFRKVILPSMRSR